MRVVNLHPGSYASNCYLLEDSGEAFILDPSAAATAILRRLREDACVPRGILLTHGHFDHIMSIDTLRRADPSLKVYIHKDDAPMLSDGEKNGFSFFFRQPRAWQEADELLTHGQTLSLGSVSLRVLHTPGHSPGSVCFLEETSGTLLTGDTLFSNTVGRWDLWGGSLSELRHSLRKLRALDGGLTIYPGHEGPNTLSKALDLTQHL